jgi:hypothetical protein
LTVVVHPADVRDGAQLITADLCGGGACRLQSIRCPDSETTFHRIVSHYIGELAIS